MATSSQGLSAKETYLRQWPANVSTPPLTLRDVDGREWNAQGLRGKVVVLNFWATWCAPCINEMQFLKALAKSEFSSGKPVILGINFKESLSAIQRFSHEHEFNYPVLMDKSGDYFRKWTDGILPTTVLIDRRGRARWRIVGELDPADSSLRQALEKMLAEPAPNHADRSKATPD